MKRMLPWVVLSSCLGISQLGAQAPFPPGFDGELYLAPRIDLVPGAEGGPYTVTLDGILNEPVWQRAAFQTVTTFLDNEDAPNLDPPSLDWDMIFACCADQDYLYIAWKVADDTLVVKENLDCNVWQDDSIEVYIDALNNGPNCTLPDGATCYGADDAQITIGADQIGNEPGNPEQPTCPEGTPVEECLRIGGVAGKASCDFNGPAPELVKGVVTELQLGDVTGNTFGTGQEGWQGEIAIALNTLGNGDDGTPTWEVLSDVGTCIGFSIQGNDDDGPELLDRDHKLAWAKREIAESAWRNPGVFGKLTFFDPTKPTSNGACALPVEKLSCKRNDDGTVLVSWTNPGTANPAIDTRIEVDGVQKATVPGDAVKATLTEADVPKDGVDHLIAVINNSDEPPPTCILIQSPFADCGGIRFWNMLGAFDQPYTAAPTDEQIRLDYLTDGVTGELDFEWKVGAQIHTDFGGSAASTGIKRGLGIPQKNPGNPPVPTVFTWQDPDSRINMQDVFKQDINNVMIYAQCYVVNNTGSPLDVALGISSDDSVQVYLNGAEVWIHSIPRGASDACTPQDISPDGLVFTDLHVLEEGSNSLLVKVFDGDGGWELAVRFQDESGEPITEGLDIVLTPPATVSEICDNLKDDDKDGKTDCEDSDCPPCAPSFHRGDADDNGKLELTDAIRILNYLFTGGVAPVCFDAADADDNGKLELTDAIRILNYLFTGGLSPAPPGPPGEPCGADVKQEAPDLGCVKYTHC